MISHLQDVDDTIFICSGNEGNIKVIKQLLRIFELLSGFKVNFDRSNLYGVNIDHVVLRNKASELGYEIRIGSINYLRVKVGVNHHNSFVWNGLLQRIKKRLDSWSGKHISMAGRVTLIQAVLFALSTCCVGPEIE